MTSRKNLKIFNLIRLGQPRPLAALIIIQTITISETFTAAHHITNAPTRPIHCLTSTAPTPTTPGLVCQDRVALAALSTLAILDLLMTHQIR